MYDEMLSLLFYKEDYNWLFSLITKNYEIDKEIWLKKYIKYVNKIWVWL